MGEWNFVGINCSQDAGLVKCFRWGLRGIFTELNNVGYGWFNKPGIMMMSISDTVLPLGFEAGKSLEW